MPFQLADIEYHKKISMEDVDFLLQTIHLVAEHIGVIIMYRSTSHNQQINRFFTRQYQQHYALELYIPY